jgi:hypothetical protein
VYHVCTHLITSQSPPLQPTIRKHTSHTRNSLPLHLLLLILPHQHFDLTRANERGIVYNKEQKCMKPSLVAVPQITQSMDKGAVGRGTGYAGQHIHTSCARASRAQTQPGTQPARAAYNYAGGGWMIIYATACVFGGGSGSPSRKALFTSISRTSCPRWTASP